jgi:hypothetical protein
MGAFVIIGRRDHYEKEIQTGSSGMYDGPDDNGDGSGMRI